MKSKMFEKETFIRSVKDNVKNLYRKTLDEASQQEIYQAVANTCLLYTSPSPRDTR